MDTPIRPAMTAAMIEWTPSENHVSTADGFAIQATIKPNGASRARPPSRRITLKGYASGPSERSHRRYPRPATERPIDRFPEASNGPARRGRTVYSPGPRPVRVTHQHDRRPPLLEEGAWSVP